MPVRLSRIVIVYHETQQPLAHRNRMGFDLSLSLSLHLAELCTSPNCDYLILYCQKHCIVVCLSRCLDQTPYTKTYTTLVIKQQKTVFSTWLNKTISSFCKKRKFISHDLFLMTFALLIQPALHFLARSQYILIQTNIVFIKSASCEPISTATCSMFVWCL